MKQLTCPWRGLAAIAVLLATNAVQAEPLPLKEVDQETIQRRLQHYLKQPASQARLKPVLGLVRLDVEQIGYVCRAGSPARLVWAYESRGPLTPVQRATVECCLEGTLLEVLAHYRGGLLSREDSRAVLAVTRLCDVTQSLTARRDRPEGLRAVLMSLMNLATTCFCCCDWGGDWGWSWDCIYWGCGSDCCGWDCCWPSCNWCGYPTWPYYYGAYDVYPGVVTFAYQGHGSYPVVTTIAASAPSFDTTPPASSLSLPRPTDAVERNISVVRRQLLLKYNTEPGHAERLYVRAVKAYGSFEYQEAQDLAWAAVQLNAQDARFWYVQALCERALGEEASALASARYGAALERLGQRDVLASMERIAGQERHYLRQAMSGLTQEQASRLVREPAVVLARQP